MSAELNAELNTPAPGDAILSESTHKEIEEINENTPIEQSENVLTEVVQDGEHESAILNDDSKEAESMANENIVELNKEKEEEPDDNKMDEEDTAIEVVAQEKNNEDEVNENAVDEQDADDVTETNEQEEPQQDDEMGLEKFEDLLGDDTKLSSVQSSKKLYHQISDDTIATIQLEAPPPPIGGDFTPLGGIKPPLDRMCSIAESRTMKEDESFEEEEEISEQILQDYTREQYYEMYNNLVRQYEDEKLKNVYLVKKLVNHYTQRKIFHVLHEGKPPLDALKKYDKLLDDFDRLTNESTTQQTKLEEGVQLLQTELAQKEHEAQTCFEKLQRQEYDVGKEIISSESARGLDEKIIDRYLKRQKIQLNILKKMRLDYIKIRNKATDTENALNALDNFGPNLRLIDYEELKMDNRNLLDKLEEKELQLTKVRINCQNKVQILAHRREIAYDLDADIYQLNKRLKNLTGEYESVREELNRLKQERDACRSSIEKMKKEAGLLNKPKVLRNMCEIIKESTYLAEQLQEVKDACNTITRKITKLRTNMSSEKKLKIIERKMKLDEQKDENEAPLYTSSYSSIDTDLSAE